MKCKECGINVLSKTQKKFCSKKCEKKGKSNVNSYKSIKHAWAAWTPQQKLMQKALSSTSLGFSNINKGY